jgi:hypothetical protein
MNSDRIAELKQLVPEDLVMEIVKAAEVDPAFRDAFYADPKGAYRRRFGTELLPGQDIVVTRRSDGSTHVYLPRIDAGFVVGPAVPPDGELSDDELELAVGGSPAADPKLFGKLIGLGTTKKEEQAD